MYGKTFWVGVAERAVKTGAQALLAGLTTGAVVWGQDWTTALGVAGTAVVFSVLTALGDPKRTDVAVSTEV